MKEAKKNYDFALFSFYKSTSLYQHHINRTVINFAPVHQFCWQNKQSKPIELA